MTTLTAEKVSLKNLGTITIKWAYPTRTYISRHDIVTTTFPYLLNWKHS